MSDTSGYTASITPHLLIIDDEEASQGMLAERLREAGLAVSLARGGADALAHIARHRPDVVLLHAPVQSFNGFATCALLRAQPNMATLPIVIMTDGADDFSIERAFAVGANDVVFKPLHLTLLLARIQNLLQARQVEALRTRAARLANIFHGCPIGIAISRTADGRYLDVNESFMALVGYSREELFQSSSIELGIWMDPAQRDALVDAVRREGRVAAWEAPVRTRTGVTRTVRFSCETVDLAGEQCLLTYCQDITERTQIEERLTYTNQQLTDTLESITDAFYALDREWNFTYVNRQTEVLLQRSRAELLGVRVWTAFPEAVHTPLYTHYHEAVRSGTPVTFQFWYEPLASWYEVAAYPTPEGLAVYYRDVTERLAAARAHQEREATLSAIFESALDAILISDDRARFVDANPAACELFGLSREHLLARRLPDFAAPERRASTEQAWEAFVRDGRQVGIFHLHRFDGQVLKLEFTARADFLPGRHMTVLRDVTARVEAEEALQASEEYLRALVEHSAEVITVLDDDGHVRYSSPAQRRLLGYPGETAGEHMFNFVHPDDQPRLQMLDEQVRAMPEQVVSTEVRVRHHNGSWHVLEATITNLLANPAVRGLVINSRDITERKRVEDQLIHNAFHDALTGLPNRALFMDRLEHALSRLSHTGLSCCAVLFLDLDRFKTVNDSLGHIVGDRLLVEMARRLTSCVRAGDTVARFGGDEFAILQEEMTTEHDAILLAERVIAALSTPFLIKDQEIASTVSIGIAVCPTDASRPTDVLRDADIAMYHAKRNGSNRYAVADPTMHDAVVARMTLESDLRRALDREELVLYYQPKLSIDGRHMLGLEALLRWQHPTRGLISPSEFIPLAEEAGLIVPLGEWVLRAACHQLQAWRTAGMPPIYVGVNLSATQFHQTALASTVQSILLETGLDAALLGLELTESVLMEDAPATVETLQRLRAIGIEHLAVDDFGTGYSSLSYLQRFPVTEIKIDRSFVQDITTNAGNAVIATAIISLAHSLGLHVIAEGIETEDQRAFLERAGCDRFQGYLAAQPMPAQHVFTYVLGRGTGAA